MNMLTLKMATAMSAEALDDFHGPSLKAESPSVV
jgi:hypothetical protein